MEAIKEAALSTVAAIIRRDRLIILYLIWQTQVMAAHWGTLTPLQKAEVRHNNARINSLMEEYFPSFEARIV